MRGGIATLMAPSRSITAEEAKAIVQAKYAVFAVMRALGPPLGPWRITAGMRMAGPALGEGKTKAKAYLDAANRILIGEMKAMKYTRESLMALDKDVLVTMLLREREVAEAVSQNFDAISAELKRVTALADLKR